MNGMKCPKCGNKETHLLSTRNEWENFCPNCDIRYNNEGVLHPFNAPQEGDTPPEPFFVDLKLGAVKAGWDESVHPELMVQLQDGSWRILSFAFDRKHGVGLFFVKWDAAELGDDHYASLMSLGSLGEMLFKAMANQAQRVGRL